MKATILFVGLNDVTKSIGLALGKGEFDVTRLGFDPDRKIARAAKKAGAIDRLVRPEREVKDASIVIVGFLGEKMRDYIELLAPNLRAGTVVVDTSPFKSATAAWVGEVLPESCSYVGLIPSVGIETLMAPSSEEIVASADLFQGGLAGVILPPSATEEALNAVLNLAQVLDATPFFIEAAESDAAQAAAELLPALVGTALFQVASKDPGWRNVQRLAGKGFASATALCGQVPAEILAGNLSIGREFVIAKLNALMERLQIMRDHLDEEQSEALLKQFSDANEAHLEWLRARQRRQWAGESIDGSDITRATMLGSFVGYDPDRFKRRE